MLLWVVGAGFALPMSGMPEGGVREGVASTEEGVASTEEGLTWQHVQRWWASAPNTAGAAEWRH